MDILFIAHNTHQQKYFEFLAKNLPFKSVVKRAGFALCKAKEIDLNKKFEEIENKYKNPIKKAFYKFYLTQESKLIYCYYKKIIEKYNPKIIGIWNGIKYPQFIINEFDIKKIYFENGFLPDTTQADCRGINALNSVPRDKKFYENLNFNKPLPDKLIPRVPARKLEGDEIDLNRDYVFIPLQVNYDSQIIYFSPWIRSMNEFFNLIYEISDYFEFDFIFKIHPSDKATDYSQIIKKAKNKKNILFATNPTSSLIKNSKAIITINSSVGIESLLFYKKVITLGEAFYNIERIVKHARNKEELIEILKNLNNWEVNEKLIKNFLSYLYYEYLIPKSWKNPDKHHIKKLTERINQCLQ
jgi:capsular polysaccharide export protein